MVQSNYGKKKQFITYQNIYLSVFVTVQINVKYYTIKIF